MALGDAQSEPHPQQFPVIATPDAPAVQKPPATLISSRPAPNFLNSSAGNSRGHVPAYGGPPNPMPPALGIVLDFIPTDPRLPGDLVMPPLAPQSPAFGNVVTYHYANAQIPPIPSLAPQPAALPPRHAITRSGPAPPSRPQHAPLQPPARLRPLERQQRRNALGDSKSDVPQVSADLEGM